MEVLYVQIHKNFVNKRLQYALVLVMEKVIVIKVNVNVKMQIWCMIVQWYIKIFIFFLNKLIKYNL